MSTIEPKDGFYPITTIHRDDLSAAGFDVSDVSDEMMLELADKLENAYVANGFWIDLPIVAEALSIPKKDSRLQDQEREGQELSTDENDAGFGKGRNDDEV